MKFSRHCSATGLMGGFRIVAVVILLGVQLPAIASSLRFFGNGVNDIDRVKIEIDNVNDNNPGPPADVGGQDFTVEFWARPTAENTAGAFSCGAGNNWILGNIVVDRDRYSQGREYGLSLGAGRLAFGTMNVNGDSLTICGTTDIRDSQWHHIAIQRRRSDGQMWLWVDGALEAQGNGPDGDISYPDDGVPLDLCTPSGTASCDFSDPYLVIGAEKHDAGPGYPSFHGWVDEVRISNVLRYNAAFTPPTQAFVADSNTAGLYHFDEGSGNFIGDSAFNSLSPGVRRFGGNPSGPAWDSASPFGTGGSAGSIRLSSSSVSVNEGQASALISVNRTGGSNGIVSVDYTTADGTAIAGSDYQSASGTLVWSNGDSAAKTFLLSIIDDALVENSETMSVTLANITGGATLGSPSVTTVTISDNDASAGSLQFATASTSVNENQGNVQIFVNRAGGAAGAVSVNYATSDGTAVAGSDYQSATGTLSWLNGDSSPKSFAVTLVDDSAPEANEVLQLTLSSVTGGATLGTPNVAAISIVDNDASSGSIQFTAASLSVGESQATATVSVSRTGGSSGMVSVDYQSANGTALAGSDYQSATGTLTWADGESSSKSFAVSVIDDSQVESTETLQVMLSNVAGGALLGTPSVSTISITDNDSVTPPPPPTNNGGGGGAAGTGLILLSLFVAAYRRSENFRKHCR